MAEDDRRTEDLSSSELRRLMEPEIGTAALLRPGNRVDNYVIREQIGEGGFAIVYAADQERPVRRRVALKIIKLGMDTDPVIARFEAERQALAIMDHPNVAKVFDAGATDTGRPYFVMELVPGVSITEHCDRNRLSIEERLRLFMSVCDAVQHAHQKGIIHRDLKPSNVLVLIRDDEAIPKVIDFGVAKAINQRLTERSIHTLQGQLIGTPEYMSPEQAARSGQDVDTRTDIYSLGVLLYELLVGSLPFDPTSLREAAFGEIQRIIREEDPPKPSTRISTMGDESQTRAVNRRIDVRGLARELRGDLDWITMMALEKDRRRRYSSASGLAEDIRRHLMHEPVHAGRPSAAYRVSKFIRRHRAFAVGVAVVAVVIIAGAVVSTVFAVGQSIARAEAESEAAKARSVITLLQEILGSTDSSIAGAAGGGHDVKVADMLDNAAGLLDQRAAGEPGIEAAVRTAIGAGYAALHDRPAADAQLTRAVTLLEEQEDENHLDLAVARFHLARLRGDQQRSDDAVELMRLSLKTFTNRLGDHELTAEAWHFLGLLLAEQGVLDEGESSLDRSLEMWESLAGPQCRGVAENCSELARCYQRKGQVEKAEAFHRRALEILLTIYHDDHVIVAHTRAGLAGVLRSRGRLDEAETQILDAIRIRRRAYGAEPHPALASVLIELALIRSAKGDFQGTRQPMREALVIYGTFGEHHDYYITTLLSEGMILRDHGRLDEAAEVLERVTHLYRTYIGEEHWHTPNARYHYGHCLLLMGRFADAEQQLLAAHKGLSKSGIEALARAAAQRLVDLYDQWGRPDQADVWRGRLSGY